MATSVEMPIATPGQPARAHTKRLRFFYTGSALLFFFLMLWGFQYFYFHGQAYPGRELTPPIRTLVIVHGIAMLAWVLLFLVQPLLIATGNRRIHMTLGKFGAGLAALVVVLGYTLGIAATRVNPPDLLLWDLNPRQFMAVPLISITVFGTFVALGVWYRKKPAIHRPMMLCSMLAAMPAALDRIGPLHGLYAGTVFGSLFGPFFSTLVIGLGLFLLKWALTRTFDRPFALGYAVLVAVGFFTMRIAPTALWDAFAGLLLG